jgi:Tol biopolymer transport system component
MAYSVTPDGRSLLFTQGGKGRPFGLWMLPLDGSQAPEPVVVSVAEQEIGFLSPDGRWLAFISNESGQNEAYVKALASADQKIRLSTNGAKRLRWSRDGMEVDYTTPDNRLVAARITTSPSLRVESSSTLFPLGAEGWQAFDVMPDGRFLASVPTVSVANEPLRVVTSVLNETPR